MLLVLRAACQTCWCQNSSPTDFRCCKCFKMPLQAHGCELGCTFLSLLTVNWQWFSASGAKEKQLQRESVLSLRTIILTAGVRSCVTILSSTDSGVRGNRKAVQKTNTLSLHSSDRRLDRTWEINRYRHVKIGVGWLSSFWLSSKRERNSRSRRCNIHVLWILFWWFIGNGSQQCKNFITLKYEMPKEKYS